MIVDFDFKKSDKQLSVPGKSDYLNDIGGPRMLGGARQRIPVEDIPLKNNNPSVTLLPEE